MKLKTLTALGLTLVLTVGCLAGCGGDTSDSEESGGETQEETCRKDQDRSGPPGQEG